jgi:hypothetical protein
MTAGGSGHSGRAATLQKEVAPRRLAISTTLRRVHYVADERLAAAL